MIQLALSTPLTPEQRDLIETAFSSAEALTVVLNDILDFSRIEAGRMQLESTALRLRDFVGDVVKPYAMNAWRRGVELVWHVERSVPDALLGDQVRLRQIISNLVDKCVPLCDFV
jgi:signal transduction histidine kinase